MTRHAHARQDPLGLTKREREIVELCCDGRTSGRIGEALGLSTVTVQRTLARAYKRLGVHSRWELARTVVAQPESLDDVLPVPEPEPVAPPALHTEPLDRLLAAALRAGASIVWCRGSGDGSAFFRADLPAGRHVVAWSPSALAALLERS